MSLHHYLTRLYATITSRQEIEIEWTQIKNEIRYQMKRPILKKSSLLGTHSTADAVSPPHLSPKKDR